MMKNEEETSPNSPPNLKNWSAARILLWWLNSLGLMFLIRNCWGLMLTRVFGMFLWWKIKGLMDKMEDLWRKVRVSVKRGKWKLKNEEPNPRFHSYREPIWARILWIRGRILLGWVRSELGSVFLCTNCRNCNFSNFFSLFRPIPNYAFDKLFINSNSPCKCNIP